MEEFKVFISQPMNGRTNEEIQEERNKITKYVQEIMYNRKVVVLDSFFKDAPHDAQPLWYLGEAIKVLSQADLAVFAKGSNKARGCEIEAKCCMFYGIPCIGYSEEGDK